MTRKVSYFYDDDIGNYYYAQGHPMKPHRMRMAHTLIVGYGLTKQMQVLRPPPASDIDMARYHADEYVTFLQGVSPEMAAESPQLVSRFNTAEDCPVFDGLWDFCQLSAGGSLQSAELLNSGDTDVAINWAGGLHHAKKAEASGFCYINDCVLAILELLKVHARVLYVDIDIHHGDGVEEAFYSTDRVMTASFHKFGDYFPGTGDVGDIGCDRGKNYSVNFPMQEGIDDDTYREYFIPVMTRIMEKFRPGAVVLQCGADSLSGDRLGCFNLSIEGHASCVDFILKYGLPVLLLGGGGYTVRNVARCWAMETGHAVGAEIAAEIPYNDCHEFFGPDFRLSVTTSNMENRNPREYLERMKTRILQQLGDLPPAPGVQFHDVPRGTPGSRKESVLGADGSAEIRKTRTLLDAMRQKRTEYYDSDDEDDPVLPGAKRKLGDGGPRRNSLASFKQRDSGVQVIGKKIPPASQTASQTGPSTVKRKPEQRIELNGERNRETGTGISPEPNHEASPEGGPEPIAGLSTALSCEPSQNQSHDRNSDLNREPSRESSRNPSRDPSPEPKKPSNPIVELPRDSKGEKAHEPTGGAKMEISQPLVRSPSGSDNKKQEIIIGPKPKDACILVDQADKSPKITSDSRGAVEPGITGPEPATTQLTQVVVPKEGTVALTNTTAILSPSPTKKEVVSADRNKADREAVTNLPSGAMDESK